MEFKVGDKVILRDGRKAKIIGNGATVCYVKCKCEDGEAVICPNTCLKPRFPWKKFKKGKFAVHCKTEEEAKDFFKYARKHGCMWSNGETLKESHTQWTIYGKNSLYDCEWGVRSLGIPAAMTYNDMSMSCNSKKYRKIVPWSNYAEE